MKVVCLPGYYTSCRNTGYITDKPMSKCKNNFQIHIETDFQSRRISFFPACENGEKNLKKDLFHAVKKIDIEFTENLRHCPFP